MADEVKCSIYYNASSKKSYLWFTGTPSTSAILFLRKDNWIFDSIKDKWRYSENGDGGYRHASKTLNRLCKKFQVKKINRKL